MKRPHSKRIGAYLLKFRTSYLSSVQTGDDVDNEVNIQKKANLFERIVSLINLEMALSGVLKNKGAPGIDGITVDKFERNSTEELERLREEILNWRYKPMPVKRVEIPKADGKGIRKLGIPCVRDRVVQLAIKQVLEPIFEAQFSSSSFGFRPYRNQEQAVHQAQRIVQSGKEYVVDIDLSNFFDRIPQDRLIGRIKKSADDPRMLKLIGMILRSGVTADGEFIPSTEGSVQGSPLSPLLSNIVLDELDKELEKRGLEFCRFADDCNIFVKTQIAGERVMESVTKFIETKLKLLVNKEKSKVALSKAVKFLGMTIIAGTIAISAKALQKGMDKVKELTPRGTHLSREVSMMKINRWYLGWSNYFKMTNYPSQLAAVEAHLRRRIRSQIIGQKKRPAYIVRDLVKKGVSTGEAKRAVYGGHKGRWKLSHTRAVEKAYPNKWFTKVLAQEIRSNHKLDHWFEIGKWVKLT